MRSKIKLFLFSMLSVILIIYIYVEYRYIPNESAYIENMYIIKTDENLEKEKKIIHLFKVLSNREKDDLNITLLKDNIPNFVIHGLASSLLMHKYENIYKTDPKKYKFIWKMRKFLFTKSLIKLDKKQIAKLFIYNISQPCPNYQTLFQFIKMDTKKDFDDLESRELLDYILLYANGCNKKSIGYSILKKIYE